jgi:flagellar basal-body rod protein FlgG
MVKGIYLAARGMQARMKNLEVVANNLANLNTTGFKEEIPFSMVMNQYGKVELQQNTDFEQGNLMETANPLDMAISGNGYFVVQTPNGTELTRNGNFKISDEGYLVDQDGNKVMGNNGAVYLDNLTTAQKKTISISKTGEISLGQDVIDNLTIAKMNDPQEAPRTTGVNFSADGVGYQIAPQGDYTVRQGYLEESNVNPIKEMETMIQLNNEYDSAHRIINYLDKSLDEANQVGKV